MADSRQEPSRRSHRWTSALQIAAVWLLASWSGAATDDDPRVAVPDDVTFQQAEELVATVFQDEISKANDTRAKSKVAREMLRVAAATEDPTERYALLCAGRDLAADIGDVVAVLHAVSKLEETYRVDGMEIKVTALLRCARAPLPTRERKDLVKEILRVVDVAAARDDFNASDKLIAAALITARKASASELVRTIIARDKQLASAREAFAGVQQARAVLQENPEDGAANEIVGRYYCLSKGDWVQGLPYLALASDAATGTVATRDLAGAGAAAERANIGDAWWNLASANQDAELPLKQRASHWYRLALQDLPAGLAQLRIAKRLEEIPNDDAVVSTDRRTTIPTRQAIPEPVQGRIAVHYKCGDQNPTDNQIKPQIKIVNSGRRSVPLGELTLRYWYTREGAKNQKWWCDYAKIGNNRVKGSFHPARRPTAAADTYLEIGFQSGAVEILPGQDSGPIQLRLANTDWSNYNESNDHSFDPAHSDFAPAPRITLYRDGILIWGAEPARQ